MARDVVRGGAEVIVNLSNDGWYRGTGGAEQHLQQVIFRAIENGVPVVRSTTTGISAVISPTGEVVARLGIGVEGVLRALVPGARPYVTFYTRFGDVFAWSCVALLTFAALTGLRGADNRPIATPARARNRALADRTARG
jgi:apolipoprotein N-acyltransferase